MSIFLGAVIQKNSNAIQKRVDEINEMIRIAKANDLSVTDKSGTWQPLVKYNLLKYTKGVLYATYEEENLYYYAKGKGRKWEKKSERYGKNDVAYGLKYIGAMYRSAVNHFKKYGY